MGIRSLADGVGIAGSAVCALHCVVAPVLLVAGTALPVAFFANDAFHHLLLWAILPASILAFGLGCLRHKDRGVLLLGLVGLIGISSSAVVPHALMGGVGERIVTIGSAGLLIAAHLRNFRRCREADCHHDAASGERGGC